MDILVGQVRACAQRVDHGSAAILIDFLGHDVRHHAGKVHRELDGRVAVAVGGQSGEFTKRIFEVG